MQKSWKTTWAGIVAILTVLTGAITLLFDGNPDTNPDWTAVGAAVSAGVGLIFSRDKNVTSEQQGLK